MFVRRGIRGRGSFRGRGGNAGLSTSSRELVLGRGPRHEPTHGEGPGKDQPATLLTDGDLVPLPIVRNFKEYNQRVNLSYNVGAELRDIGLVMLSMGNERWPLLLCPEFTVLHLDSRLHHRFPNAPKIDYYDNTFTATHYVGELRAPVGDNLVTPILTYLAPMRQPFIHDSTLTCALRTRIHVAHDAGMDVMGLLGMPTYARHARGLAEEAARAAAMMHFGTGTGYRVDGYWKSYGGNETGFRFRTDEMRGGPWAKTLKWEGDVGVSLGKTSSPNQPSNHPLKRPPNHSRNSLSHPIELAEDVVGAHYDPIAVVDTPPPLLRIQEAGDEPERRRGDREGSDESSLVEGDDSDMISLGSDDIEY